MDAIERIKEGFDRNSDSVFLIDAQCKRSFTRREFRELVARTASYLRGRGVGAGDRVVLVLPNGYEMAGLYFGCLALGAVAVPINPVLHPKDVEFIAQSVRARILFYAPSCADRIGPDLRAALEGRVSCLVPEIEKENRPEGVECWSFDDLPAESLAGWSPFDGVGEESFFSIMFTSGTTERPKGVVHSVKNVVNNADRFIRQVGLGPHNRFYCVLSMAYMGGAYNLTYLPFLAGASVVISHTFDSRSAFDFWDAPIQYEANTLWLVPTMLSFLLRVDRHRTAPEFCRKQVRFGFVGTAPLYPSVRKEFEKKYGISLYENYGLSETLFVTANVPGRPVLDGSVGPALPGVDLSVRDGKGRSLEPTHEGEIFIRMPDRMVGYLDAVSGGVDGGAAADWFPTGDLGIVDGDGNVFITGRKKDLIIRGGVNVSPLAVETKLLTHQAVYQAAVVGIPHELYGEEIAAVVKLKDGRTIDDIRSSLEDLCRTELDSTQRPTVYLQIDEFPLSSTGKISKARLRDLLVIRRGP